MFKIDKYDNQITLTRGDSAEIVIDLKDTNNDSYIMGEADTLTFTVKTSVNDRFNTLQKTVTGINCIEILPEDTSSLAFKKYVYDIQLNTEDGKVYTIIPPATFLIAEEVTV